MRKRPVDPGAGLLFLGAWYRGESDPAYRAALERFRSRRARLLALLQGEEP